MTQLHDTTTSHKGTHLKLGDRYQIEVLIKEGLRPSQIAQRLGRHRTTITNEIERGTVRIVRQRQTSQSDKVYTYSMQRSILL